MQSNENTPIKAKVLFGDGSVLEIEHITEYSFEYHLNMSCNDHAKIVVEGCKWEYTDRF